MDRDSWELRRDEGTCLLLLYYEMEGGNKQAPERVFFFCLLLFAFVNAKMSKCQNAKSVMSSLGVKEEMATSFQTNKSFLHPVHSIIPNNKQQHKHHKPSRHKVVVWQSPEG